MILSNFWKTYKLCSKQWSNNGVPFMHWSSGKGVMIQKFIFRCLVPYWLKQHERIQSDSFQLMNSFKIKAETELRWPLVFDDENNYKIWSFVSHKQVFLLFQMFLTLGSCLHPHSLEPGTLQNYCTSRFLCK